MKTFVDATGKAMRNKTPLRRCGTIFQDQADGAALLGQPIPGEWALAGPGLPVPSAGGSTWLRGHWLLPSRLHVLPESFQGEAASRESQPALLRGLSQKPQDRSASTGTTRPASEPREGDLNGSHPWSTARGSFQKAMK